MMMIIIIIMVMIMICVIISRYFYPTGAGEIGSFFFSRKLFNYAMGD